jgi:hypothetical protein
MLANATVKITQRDNGLFHGLAPWEAIAIRQCLAHSDQHHPCLILHANDATVYETALLDLVTGVTFARIHGTTAEEMKEQILNTLQLHPASSCIILNGLLNHIPKSKEILAQHLGVLGRGRLLIVFAMVNNDVHESDEFNFEIRFAPLSILDLTRPGAGTLICQGVQSREFPQEWPQCVLACSAFRGEAGL